MGWFQEDNYDAEEAKMAIDVQSMVTDALRGGPGWNQTQQDAREAARAVLDLLADFPHAGEPPPAGTLCGPSRSAWLAALLTLLARHEIHGPVPAWLFDGPRASGKSLQVEMLSAIAHRDDEDWKVWPTPWPGTSAEVAAVIESYARMIMGDERSLLVFDNVVGTFGGDALDRCLTATELHVRQPGGCEVVKVPWRAVVMATGRNVEISPDTARRVLVVRTTGEAGGGAHGGASADSLRRQALKARPAAIQAALIMLRAWVVAGRPICAGPSDWPGFEAWSAIIPHVLCFAGCANPLLARPAAAEVAP